MNVARKIWERGRALLPVASFYFDRPLVLLQSDDWGRVGVRDREGFEQLCSAGIALGERPYDFYSLETAEDLAALSAVLKRHRDSTGRHPCLVMNFILSNLDFAKTCADDGKHSHFLPISEGLPQGWRRPGLIEGYAAGISDGVFYPGLHGLTHFCRSAVERNWANAGQRRELLQTLWHAGTPYIHWRTPWVGYEYWDPEQPRDERFLSAETQRSLVGDAVGAFARTFSMLPRSACAPGYRANDDTHLAWAQHGILIAQNGPGLLPPYIGRHALLHLTRTVEFEPAIDSAFSVEACVRQAERCLQRGVPAIVSIHSINFHSTVRDFRSRTLMLLDQFLSALESQHRDLLYLHDQDLRKLIHEGRYEAAKGKVQVKVVRKRFIKRAAGQLEA